MDGMFNIFGYGMQHPDEKRKFFETSYSGDKQKRGQISTDSNLIRQNKEVRDRLGRITQPGSPINAQGGFQSRFKKQVTLPDGTKQWMGPGEMIQKGFNVPTESAKASPNKVYQDAIMRGGKGANVPNDLNWWQKLSGMFNSKFDLEGAKASWTQKGGFEGLMANPAFTMGLAFMQAGAEGKTLGQGALDNVIKAGGISHTYKKIIEDRKQEPIQATAADMAEVESILKSINIEKGNWLENLITKAKGGHPGAEWSAAVEEIAVKYQEDVAKWQRNNKNPDGTPKTIRQGDKLKIMQKLIDSGEIKFDKGNILFAGTIKKPVNYAQGGQIQKGQHAIVGEGGPEYFLPKESGKILSNDDSRIFSMLLAANPQLQNVSRTRSEKILRNRFPEYFD